MCNLNGQCNSLDSIGGMPYLKMRHDEWKTDTTDCITTDNYEDDKATHQMYFDTTAVLYVIVSQLFAATDAMGTKPGSHSAQTLQDTVRRRGVLTRLLCDDVQPKISEKVKDVLRHLIIGDRCLQLLTFQALTDNMKTISCKSKIRSTFHLELVRSRYDHITTRSVYMQSPVSQPKLFWTGYTIVDDGYEALGRKSTENMPILILLCIIVLLILSHMMTGSIDFIMEPTVCQSTGACTDHLVRSITKLII